MVEAAIEELRAIAPLHNEPALRGLREARAALPGLPHVAAFDTAFHATIPAHASTYAVPRAWREELGIRRFGFHGLNVEWVASQVQVSAPRRSATWAAAAPSPRCATGARSTRPWGSRRSRACR